MASIRGGAPLAFRVDVDDKGVVVRIPHFKSVEALRAYFKGPPERFVFYRLGGPELKASDLKLFRPTVLRVSTKHVRHDVTTELGLEGRLFGFVLTEKEASLSASELLSISLGVRHPYRIEPLTHDLARLTKPDSKTGELLPFDEVTTYGPIDVTEQMLVASSSFLQGGADEEIGTQGAAFLALKMMPGAEATVYFRDLSHFSVKPKQGAPTGASFHSVWDKERNEREGFKDV